MWAYLLINFIIILVPFVLAFEKKRVHYISKFPAYLLAFLIAGGVFLIWDRHATLNSHWGFNPKYTLGYTLFSLPIEEILFFVTVPFSCLFIWECLLYFNRNTKASLPNFSQTKLRNLLFGISLVSLVAIFFLMNAAQKDYFYTILVLGYFVGLNFLAIIAPKYFSFLRSKLFWKFILITYFPFIIFNYILTSPPIVWYAPEAILGLRIGTIPIEDFLYSYVMLTSYLVVYEWAKIRFNLAKLKVSTR